MYIGLMRIIVTGILLLLFLSKGEAQNDSIRVVADSMIALPYTAYCDTGIASWYGHKWKGRLTASGERFHPDSMTAAHKTLPFGTIVKVTNTKNDSVVYLRITDRLPKKSSRTIDVTPAAAKRLGFYSQGLQQVIIESKGRTAVRKNTTSQGANQTLWRK